MKKKLLLLLMSLLFFITAEAQAQECCNENNCCYEDDCCGTNFYAKILSGANWLQYTGLNGNKSTYYPGYMIGGSVGYCWRYGFSLEAEYAFRRNVIRRIFLVGQGFSNNGDTQVSSYMANLFWDLPLYLVGCDFWNTRPFIGAGIGYDYQRMHAVNSLVIFDQKWKHYSWQVMTGLAYPIFCNTEITLEYKYHQGGCHFHNHTLGVGLIYKFGF